MAEEMNHGVPWARFILWGPGNGGSVQFNLSPFPPGKIEIVVLEAAELRETIEIGDSHTLVLENRKFQATKLPHNTMGVDQGEADGIAKFRLRKWQVESAFLHEAD